MWEDEALRGGREGEGRERVREERAGEGRESDRGREGGCLGEDEGR